MLPLAQTNAHARDAAVAFEPVEHVYTVTRDGAAERVPVSATGFAKAYFEEFDAEAVVDANFEKWKRNVNSKYYAVIHAELNRGGSDADAKRAIREGWAANATRASEAGTAMHDKFERVCNGLAVQDDAETRLLRAWLADFQPHMQWRPHRTEWPLWYESPRIWGGVLLAGTLDLLLRSETTGEFALVDFKRTNPAPKYAGGPPCLLGPCADTRFHPGWAAAPLGEIENSSYGKYAVQLNVLAKMLREKYDVEVGANMYLLQAHEDLAEAHCVRVPSVRLAVDELFAIEAERRRALINGASLL